MFSTRNLYIGQLYPCTHELSKLCYSNLVKSRNIFEGIISLELECFNSSFTKYYSLKIPLGKHKNQTRIKNFISYIYFMTSTLLFCLVHQWNSASGYKPILVFVFNTDKVLDLTVQEFRAPSPTFKGRKIASVLFKYWFMPQQRNWKLYGVSAFFSVFSDKKIDKTHSKPNRRDNSFLSRNWSEYVLFRRAAGRNA